MEQHSLQMFQFKIYLDKKVHMAQTVCERKMEWDERKKKIQMKLNGRKFAELWTIIVFCDVNLVNFCNLPNKFYDKFK